MRVPRFTITAAALLTHASHGLSYPDFTKENHDGRPQEEVDEVPDAPPQP